MPDHPNLELIRGWASLWTERDFEALAALFTVDCVYEDVALGEVNRGRDALIAFGKATIVAFPDFTVELHSAVADDHRGSAEWTMSGTHEGDFPGLPATGKRFSVRGSSVMRFADGLIAYNGDYWSVSTFLRQVGLSEAPVAETAE